MVQRKSNLVRSLFVHSVNMKNACMEFSRHKSGSENCEFEVSREMKKHNREIKTEKKFVFFR